MVKELRERTGAGMMDCKSGPRPRPQGDMEKAIDLLRKKGLAAAAKKAGRVTAEGAVGSYIHAGGKIGVLVEVNCETDFVARTDEFQELVRDIAMHIAAAEPRFVRREEVTADVLERERAIFREQALASGKPADGGRRSSTGKIEKYYAEYVLLEQPFVKDPDKTVGQLDRREGRQDRREHPGPPLRPLQAGRGHREAPGRLRRRSPGPGGRDDGRRGAASGAAPAYRRVLLKLSGEALMGAQPFGIDEAVVAAIADEMREVHALGRARSRSSSAAATSSAAWPPATAASTG